MPLYAALIYTPDPDWDADDPTPPTMSAGYTEFGKAHEAVIRGGNALYPTASATTVRVTGGQGGDVVTTDGPFIETKEVLSGFYLLECEDLDEAVKIAARIPAAWDNGAVEIRPIVTFRD
jgi:hypothetical protein